jgi:hypothetical protein
MAQYGNGASITWDSSYFAEPINIDWSGVSRPVIDTTHLGTTVARTFIGGKVYDPGTLQVEMAFNSTKSPTILSTATATTCTLTVPGTGTNTASWAASGFMSEFQWGAPMDDRQTATATIKLSGAITVTTAA